MARAQARYWPTTGQVNEVYPNDDGPQDYPTFTALYPEWVWRYYLSTGDEATVVGLLPTLRGCRDTCSVSVDPATGLISGLTLSTNGDNQYGYDYNTDADTTMNVLSANAHRRIGLIAQLAGDPSSAAAESELGSALTRRINQLLVVAGRPLRRRPADRREPERPLVPGGQCLGLGLRGLPVGTGGHGGSVRGLPRHLRRARPGHGALAGPARRRARRRRGAHPHRLVLPRLGRHLEGGGTFTWETWTPSDLIGDSMSHGWGSSALVAVQEALLGAVPLVPGPGDPPTVVSVTPPATVTRLEWAKGSFPTPAGAYDVSWRHTESGLHVGVTVPPNAAAHCTLPATSAERVTESGGPLSGARGVTVTSPPGSALTLSVASGSYDFDVST